MTYPALTVELVLPILEEIVAAQPDFVYRIDADVVGGTCKYERNGKPSCLVGQVLHRVGYSIEDLRELDTADDHIGVIDTTISVLVNANMVYADQDTALLLSAAQTAQDNGETWQTALERAKDVLVPAL